MHLNQMSENINSNEFFTRFKLAVWVDTVMVNDSVQYMNIDRYCQRLSFENLNI